MIQIIWEFVIRAGAIGQFEQEYGPNGAWSRLFQDYPGFRGTTLLRDADNPRRYLTIDLWDTRAHRKRMLTRGRKRYADLDAALADLTESENEIGTFTTAPIATSRRRSTAKGRKVGGVRRASRRTTRCS